MERFTVCFQYNGSEESQSGEYIISDKGNPLRFKPVIDTAIETWRRINKVQQINLPVINIRVFNSIGKLIAEQANWTDFNGIVEII